MPVKSAGKTPRNQGAADNARAWLFTGPERGEKAAAVKAVRKQAEKRCGAIEDYKYYAADIKAGELVSLLQNGSLFSAGKFVVVENAELIKLKDEIATLTDWIRSGAAAESEGSNSFLVLTSDEISVDKKLESAVPAGHKKIFWELFEERKEQWVSAFFRGEGLPIDGKAVRLILEMVENNTEALRAACAPFPLFYERGTTITETEVEYIISHNREESAFTLFDALAKHDFENAAAIFRKISLSKESAPPQIIAGLTYCFRRLWDWHMLAAESGAAEGRSGGIPADVLKRAGFASQKIQNQYRAAARLWNGAAVERILALLTDTDGELRSTGAQMHGVIFERTLYRIHRLAENAGAPAPTTATTRRF